MDTREKNIEKMSSDLCDALSFTSDTHVDVTSVDAKATARRLYAAGYRKQSVSAENESVSAVELVEVIRCANCAHWEKAKINRKGFLICPITRMEIYTSDFCSYAEREKHKEKYEEKKNDDL